MRILHILFIIFPVFLLSCSSSDNSNVQGDKKGKKLIMTPMVNPQTGEITGHIPLPKKWKVKDNAIVGPQGVKTTNYPNQFYMFQQRRPIDLVQVVKQDIEPLILQAGGKILGTFVIPELENYDRAYSDLLWKFGNPRNEFHVLGVDCEGSDGNKSLIVIRQMITKDQYGGSWMYYINALDANSSAYEEAKSDYIFALSHVQPNMEQIQAYNQREIQKSNASWAAHRSRMAANQAAFNARNQAWMETSNAISDMSMKGWRDRNKMNDAGHASSMNAIREEETIYNSASGQSMNVEAGSNRYFTNGNNEYIRTDDYLYDPNMDNSVNQYEWTEWKGN